MDCLGGLIKCRFLKNTGVELKRAQTAIRVSDANMESLNFHPCLATDRKQMYNYYMSVYDFKSSFNEIDVNNPEMVYYLQEDNIVWIACRSKSFIDQAVIESCYTTGDVCLHRAKHFIQSKLFHTVMFDLSFQISPPTVN